MFSSPLFLSGRRCWFAWILGLIAVGSLSLWGGTPVVSRAKPVPPQQSVTTADKEKLSFNTHVQPILSENCYHCHGPDPGSRKAELRLDRAEFAYAPHEKSGPAIIPGDAVKSPLVRRIEAKDEKEIMPPPEAHKTLRPEEIALLRRWIEEGAEYQEHWAFIAPQRPTVPGTASVASAGWPRNPVDAFILARLGKAGLAPSPEADRRTLIRRVAFDLTGLAPSPAEVEAFVHDSSPDAYERVVDRLLASPRYGEHRTRYWLDYVRYADTHGLHYDNYRSIWPYRDYVIRAFNTNKPFDRFVQEQLAGDLLPARTIDELTATGFVRNSVTTNEGGTIPEEVVVALARDRVEAFGGTFLGLTTGCAACHDHKFDPISQKDFYTLAAFLNNTADRAWDFNAPDPAPVFRMPKDENRAAVEQALATRADVQTRLAARHRVAEETFRRWLAAGHRPRSVSTANLELRLRFDEGRGDVLKNTAVGTSPREFKAHTNPLVWGEEAWLWPSARFEMSTQLPLGTIGDVEVDEPFSAGGWIKLRDKAGAGINQVTGSIFSRVVDTDRGGRGWEIFYEKNTFVVNIVQDNNPAAAAFLRLPRGPLDPTAFITLPAIHLSPLPNWQKPIQHAIQVAAKNKYPREWTHVFVTYDGSGRAAGVRLFINGQPVETQIRTDSLEPGKSIRSGAVTHLGRRHGAQPLPLRELRYQDIRFYRRALSAAETARLAYEEIAAELMARKPDPAQWNSDERFIVLEKFFLGERDAEAKQLTAELAAIDARIDALTAGGAPTLITREKSSPAYADILKRGSFADRIERVQPAPPHFLPPLPAGASRDRLGLARWLVSAEQPLTARVTVNRMWQEVFGRGLVETAEDFGVMGARPSHPELLDWLAVEFRESGWDVKNLYRLLVLSATYRQSAAVTADRLAKDPANRLLARGPRFRLDGEMIRDAALQTSGLLVEKIGGPSVKPYQPAGLWEEVAIPGSTTGKYEADKGDALYRRSVYTFWKRSSPPPSMETFDAPSREVVCIRRPRSNTPLQALVIMNDPQFLEAARKLAERAVQAAPEPEARLDFLALTALSRPLDAREHASFTQARSRYRTHFQTHPADATALLGIGQSPVATLDPVELAEWTMVSSQFLNLDEFLTK